MSKKVPTKKELHQIVTENRQAINISFKAIEEIKNYANGIDRLVDWYVEYKEDIDGFKQFIKENKVQKNADGTEDGILNKQEDLSESK